MKSVSKKVVALVLAVVMMCSFTAFAFAEEQNDIVFATDSLNGDVFAITGITDGTVGSTFTIPDTIVKYGAELAVSAVGEEALSYNEADPTVEYLKNVTSIVVSEGINSIGKAAFSGYPNLENVTFMGDVEIGDRAFENCSKLNKVTFNGNASMGDDVFDGCTALDSIITATGKTYNCPKSAVEDTPWFNDYTVDFVTLGTTLIYYKGHDEIVTIPLNVTAIGEEAFAYNTELRKVIFTKYIDTLGNKAFYRCENLEEVVISNFGEIVNIGSDIFTGTPYFDNFEGEFFTIGDTLIKYTGENIPYVTIPNTVKAIAAECFRGCYAYSEEDGYTFVISSICVPASVTEFGEDCFILERFSDNSCYTPRIYAYSNTPAEKALEEAGYTVINMENKIGDLDNDDAITSADARLALRYAVGLEGVSEVLKQAGDVDGDNAVTAEDARLILRIAVGLENITIDDLLTVPKTTYEIVTTYKNAIKQAEVYGLGYTKDVEKDIFYTDICSLVASKVISAAETDGACSETVEYFDKNSQEAVDALPQFTAQNLSIIKEAECVPYGDYYYIRISFYDTADCVINAENPEYTGVVPAFAAMIPTVSGETFYNAFSAQKWFKFVENDVLALNCLRSYSLDYLEPEIEAVIEKDTGKPVSITLSVIYDFVVDAKISGIEAGAGICPENPAEVMRFDSVSYEFD